MKLLEMVTGGGGVLLIVLTLVQIAPVKLNPWSKIGELLGRAVNGEVLKKLGDVERRLDSHIQMDDERNADMHRARILQFNTELLRGIRHTEEDFNEILYNIDCYERYCEEHPEYPNNRAVLAIENIREVYKERLKRRDFLQESHAKDEDEPEPAV